MIYLTHYRTASTANVELMDDVVYPQKVHWFPETYSRVKSGLFYPPHSVADKVLDPNLLKFLVENPSKKTAFILAAGNSQMAGLGHKPSPTNRLSYIYKFMPLTLTQVYAGRIAQSCGKIDSVTTDSSACASSLKIMMDVQNLINYYDFDRVIVLSVEDGVSNLVLEFFGETKASLTEKQEQSGIKPSAFDSVNFGFRLGQGAAFAVFESSDFVEFQKIKPQAQLIGAYTASEHSTNVLGQQEDGEGFIKAMKGAIYYGKINIKDIRIIKTHGTGTVSNNKAEKNALNNTLSNFVATSYKQKIGHTMGTSGLLETLLLLDDIKYGIIPCIENRTEVDNIFLSTPISAPEGLIMSLSAGMGNVYSAAIFKNLQ